MNPVEGWQIALGIGAIAVSAGTAFLGGYLGVKWSGAQNRKERLDDERREWRGRAAPTLARVHILLESVLLDHVEKRSPEDRAQITQTWIDQWSQTRPDLLALAAGHPDDAVSKVASAVDFQTVSCMDWAHHGASVLPPGMMTWHFRVGLSIAFIQAVSDWPESGLGDILFVTLAVGFVLAGILVALDWAARRLGVIRESGTESRDETTVSPDPRSVQRDALEPGPWTVPKFCVACGREFPGAGAKFCPECGHPATATLPAVTRDGMMRAQAPWRTITGHRRGVAVVGLGLCLLLAGDWLLRNREMAQLLDAVENSEQVTMTGSDEINEVVRSANARLTQSYFQEHPYERSVLLSEVQASIRDAASMGAEEVVDTSDHVASVSVLPWHRSVQRAKSRYLDHAETWEAHFTAVAGNAERLSDETPQISATFKIAERAFDEALTPYALFGAQERVDAIFES